MCQKLIFAFLIGGLSAAAPGCRKSEPSAGPPSQGSSDQPVSQPPAAASSGAEPPPAPPATTANAPKDDRVRAAIDDLIARYEAIDSLFVRTEQKMNEAMGLKGNTHGKGEFMLKREGDQRKTLFRVNNRFEFVQKDPKNVAPIRTQEILWQLYDGADLYLLYMQHNLKRIVRAHYDPARIWKIGGRDLFREILDDNEVTLLPDEELNGRAAYVFSVKPRDGDWSGKQWFDKKLGIRVKMIETDAAGTETFSVVVSDIDEKPTLADDTFVYQPREGFEVVDEVNPQPAGTESTPPAGEAPTKPETDAKPPEGAAPETEKKDGAEPEKSEAPPEKTPGNTEPK